MKRKEYDDDLLVKLLARNDRSYARIAADVGISKSHVALLARGRARRDLHPRIRAAAEKLLPQLRRDGPWRTAARGGPQKHPDYDDQLMVELIARGELSYKEIARRLGVSRAAVAHVATGHTRKDLQERINTTMRRHLALRRKQHGRNRRRLVDYAMPGLSRKQKDYDDNLLIDLIARGDRSHRSIAREVGLSSQTVRRIALGEMRPELQPRIASAGDGYRREARRLGARWLRGLLARHIRDGIEGDGEHARKCREFALKFIEDCGRFNEIPPPRPEPSGDVFDDLSLELRKKIMAEIGGPSDDDAFVEIHDDPDTAGGRSP